MQKHNQLEQTAKQIAQQLRKQDAHLSPHLTRQLKTMRENAIRQAHASPLQKNGRGTLSMSLVQYRYPVVLLFCALVLALSFVWMQAKNNTMTSDAYLLSEDLPPEAFVDEEFDTWISKDSY